MKSLKSICCLLLSFTLLASFSACKENPSEDSGSTETEIVYVYQNAEGNEISSGSNNNQSGNKSPDNSSKNNNNSAGADGGNMSAYKEKAKKYKGTTVRYATWKDPELNEDGPVIEAFEKEYGINVEIDMKGQTEYAFEIAGMIAADNSPDIYFANNDLPHFLSCVQPIDAAEIDRTDPIWDQSLLEASTINGKTYLVNTVGNIWNEAACVFYNKRLMEENSITTPEEYYNSGKWNFDALTKVMRDVAALGSDYIGGYIDWENALGLTGSSYYRWENGKFTNGITNTLKDVMVKLSEYLKEGLIKGIGDYNRRDDFVKGKTGIAITDAFGLKGNGYFAKMNPDDIGFTYLPSFSSSVPLHSTGIYRGWGIIKGSKNPVAAGIFLRYYLDVNNYDLSASFINSEAESFFFKLTSASTQSEKFYVPTIGCSRALGSNWGDLSYVATNDPSQVRSKIDAMNNRINSEIKELNAYIDKYTK